MQRLVQPCLRRRLVLGVLDVGEQPQPPRPAAAPRRLHVKVSELQREREGGGGTPAPEVLVVLLYPLLLLALAAHHAPHRATAIAWEGPHVYLPRLTRGPTTAATAAGAGGAPVEEGRGGEATREQERFAEEEADAQRREVLLRVRPSGRALLEEAEADCVGREGAEPSAAGDQRLHA